MSLTVTNTQLVLYIGSLIILFITPGPVWVAIVARTVSGGARSGLPLIIGVSLGDMLWPIIVFLGFGILISVYSDFLIIFRVICAIILALMGLELIINSKIKTKQNNKLIKTGFFSGVIAGFFAITANPKAALFYLTLLPSFFNFLTINILDLFLISLISFFVPFIGNILLIFFLSKMRSFISSENAIFKLNLIAGLLLIFVAIIILLNK